MFKISTLCLLVGLILRAVGGSAEDGAVSGSAEDGAVGGSAEDGAVVAEAARPLDLQPFFALHSTQ